MVAGGRERWGEGLVREFGVDMYTLIYLKWVTYYVAHGTLINVMCQPRWEVVWERMDTCRCMADSLRCETTTALLIG